MINFLFSGCLASFIITLLFYWLGIRPFLKNIINTDLASKIAKSIAGVTGTNNSDVQQQNSNNQIEATLLEGLFPKAFNYVKNYEITHFIRLQNKYNLTCGFPTFCQKDSHAWDKLTKHDKKRIEKERQKFLIKVAKLVLV